MIGGGIESLGNNTICLCFGKGYVFNNRRTGAETVKNAQDFCQQSLIFRTDLNACITLILFLFPYFKDGDLEIAPHLHDGVKDLGHDSGINDMAFQFNLPRIFHVLSIGNSHDKNGLMKKPQKRVSATLRETG